MLRSAIISRLPHSITSRLRRGRNYLQVTGQFADRLAAAHRENEELRAKVQYLKERDLATNRAFAAINDVVNKYRYGGKSTPETRELAKAISEAWSNELKDMPKC